ncbi:MAG: type IVB secretion system protein IcmH/DotU [Gammaproteobacteria bacterium]|nr:type IVB secretion system protein IcmH/DotU [Gammaproteobacteria bacterium]MCH9743709.1 type IVB secretion system protein IcmH/DotU [Gammaproteobacteria bacterium]
MSEDEQEDKKQDTEKTVVFSDSKKKADDDPSAIAELDIKVESFLDNSSELKKIDSLDFASKIGLNPLVTASMPIIAILIELKRQHEACDILKLRGRLLEELRSFNQRGSRIDISPTTLILSRYILATVVDEFVLNAAWSKQSNWDEDPITSILFEDAVGGEKFFSILEKIIKDPSSNIELIELMYICLSLGFEGKYRLMDHGLERLGMLKESLYRIIKKQRCLLTSNAQTITPASKFPTRDKLPSIPWRKLLLITLGLLAIGYFSFWISLYSKASSTKFYVQQLGQQNSFDESGDSVGF